MASLRSDVAGCCGEKRRICRRTCSFLPYLGGSVGTFAINFSRPAGQVIAQYYNFLRLGREGYTRINRPATTHQWLAKEIGKLGPFEFINDGNPETGIPAVCFRVKPGVKLSYTLYDLSDRLLQRGWQVPAFALTGDAKDISVMRVMIRQGVKSGYGRPAGGRHQACDRAFRQASDHSSDDPKGSPSTHPHLMRSHSRRGRRECFLVADGSNSPTTCLWFSRKGIDHV